MTLKEKINLLERLKEERDEILEPDRQDANYIGYNKKADLASREIIKELLLNL